MKLLVATSETQGCRVSDFIWCTPGEIVSPVVTICDGDKYGVPARGCGCARSFEGLSSHKATTTAEVRNVADVTIDDLTRMVRDNLAQEASDRLYEFTGDELNGLAAGEAAVIAAAVAGHAEGTVLEIRPGGIRVRPVLRLLS